METDTARGSWSGYAARWVALLLTGAALVGGQPVSVRANGLCSNFTPPQCGDATGDADCASGEDCIDDNAGGCTCRPRICCKCSGTGVCDLPCTETGIGLLVCIAGCVAAEAVAGDCALAVVDHSTCSDGNCATSGCCTFQDDFNCLGSGLQTGCGPDLCAETDEDTCNAIPGLTFVAGGSCSGGLTGSCVGPTPTETATAAATLPPTDTPTANPTASASATPTNTPTTSPTVTATPMGSADGVACIQPTQCQSGFCVQGVCCNTACDAPLEICDDPTLPGTCITVTPAPTATPLGLVIAIVTLVGVALISLSRRRAAG